jgi:hypothetical protein
LRATLLCFGWTYKAPNDNQDRAGHASGFVISVRDRWFLITAGHVIEEIEEAQKLGYMFSDWYLDDTGAAGAKSSIVIPFDYDNAPKFWFHDGSGADYALISLHPHYRRLLESNNIVALSEQAWRTGMPNDFDVYWMLGVPNEFVEATPGNSQIQKSDVIIAIDRLDEPPDEMCTELPRLYGKIPDELGDEEQALTSIKGMSGGPIFGFKLSNGQLRYWIVALQSGWLQRGRIIAGCPIEIFAEWIDQQLIPSALGQ